MFLSATPPEIELFLNLGKGAILRDSAHSPQELIHPSA